MKFIGFILALGYTIVGHAQTDSLFFKSEREMLEYAFQNTDLTAETDGLFLDYWESPDTVWMVLDSISSLSTVASDHIYQVGTILDRADLTGNFEREAIFHPIFDHIQSLDHSRTMRVPIMMYDTKISNLTPSARTTIENWTSIDPFPLMTSSSFESTDFFFGSLFFDSIAYDRVVLYWDDNTIRTNTNRMLDRIDIDVNGIGYTLYAGDELNITDWSGSVDVIVNYIFDDNSSETVHQIIEKTPSSVLPKSGFWDFTNTIEAFHLDGTNGHPITIDNPELQFSIKYGCQEGKILKPFIVLAGWGTHTNIPNINDIFEWPSSLGEWAESTNEAGFIENLHDQGYDVIMAKFYPPNASILQNAELLEKLIKQVNVAKMDNGSFEENIIAGYSAGALCVKHTLLAMEKKYLDNSGPHHHTKLYISYDGEQQGANIPLGLQHHVKYLYNYEHTNNNIWFNSQNWSPGAAMYALNYILEAPLSRELLSYYYTGTGDSNDPHQGPDLMRVEYLNDQFYNNHWYNADRLGYPAFCRSVSISNGSSVPDIDMNTFQSDHFPFPVETGSTYFEATTWRKHWEARFLTHGTTNVFVFEKRPLFSSNWNIEYEAVTHNMPVLDNAPGGTIFLNNNPLDAVLDVSAFEMLTVNEAHIEHFDYAQYSFTPTVYTHDIKTFDPFANGGLGYMNFNFKEEDLNFDNEFDASTGNPIFASNAVGYPHLGYPTNHYAITSFDALFTADFNTEHVTASKVGVNNEGRFVPLWTDLKNTIKNFMVEEAEPEFIFLQNDHIGKESIGGWPYRVEFKADQEIYIGKHVTQKTDFKELILDNHSMVTTMAGEAIYIKDGFHAQVGSEWHAFIGDEICVGKSYNGGNANGNGLSANGSENRVENENAQDRLLIVPNPSNGEIQFLIRNSIDNEAFSYYLSDLRGNRVVEGTGQEGARIVLNLQAGIYIVSLKTTTSWYTEKLIIQ